MSFKDVIQGEAIESPLRIRNLTNSSITLSHFEIGCSCLGITPNRNIVLLPNQTKTILIKLRADSTNSKIDLESGLSSGSTVLTAVYKKAKSEPSKVSAIVRYTIRAEVLLNPASIDFGIISHRSPLVGSTTIRLFSPTRSVKILPHPDWHTHLEPADAQSWTLYVKASRPMDPRTVHESIEYVVRTEDGRNCPIRSIPLRGEIVEDIHTIPSTLHFGKIQLDHQREESFRIESRTGRKFFMKRWECDSTDVKLTRYTEEENTLLVSLIPKRHGSSIECEHTIRVVVVDDRAAEHLITIPVRYHLGAGGVE